MVFFSSDAAEVAELSREFTEAGIACELRKEDLQVDGYPMDAELWVRDDRDCHRAWLLCVHRNLGFARRQGRTPEPEVEYVLEKLPDD
jgi:hypothetical protein